MDVVNRFTRIDPDAAGGPLYRGVKAALLLAIERRECAPGDALPSERELALAFGVSIGTVRRAVDELTAEHIVARRQGRGTFVAVHDSARFLFRFFHVERSDGLREAPQVELLSFERSRADDDAAAALSVKPGDAVFRLENRLMLQGRPVIHDRLTLSARLFKDLTEKRFRDRPSTIYHLYQTMFGITVTRAHERARAVAVDRAAARVLGLAIGTPAIEVRRIALTFGDKPVEWRLSTINTAQHEYVHTLRRPT
jgi:GntR family transcriptional regulator